MLPCSGRGERRGCSGRARVRDGRAELVRRRADVAGCVLGGDLVEVGAGRESAVAVGRAGRLRDPVGRRGREAGRRAAVDVVAYDGDVVRRRRPAQVDRVADDGSDQTGRRTRRGRVRRHRRGGLVRGRADVAGCVLGGDLVEVDARRGVVHVGRPRRLSDPVSGARSEARNGRAVDVVANDADVVGRRSPAQVRPSDRAGRSQRSGRARGRRVTDRCARLVRRGADVARRVFRGHPVEVGPRSDVVRVARARRLRDPVRDARREAGRRRTVDVVPHHADVVGRRAPTQLRRSDGPRRGERSRRTGRGGVG